MAKKNKKIEQLHSPIGWQYGKVNDIINQINDIFLKEKITFVEELVVLSWFNAQLTYNMSRHGTKDFIEETLPRQPNTKPSNSGIA